MATRAIAPAAPEGPPVVLDLAAFARATGVAAAEALRSIVRDEIRAIFVEREATALQPLEKIVDGLSVAAARSRLHRDPELRAIGIPSGKRLLFRPQEVLNLLASRRGGRRLRVVGGGAR